MIMNRRKRLGFYKPIDSSENAHHSCWKKLGVGMDTRHPYARLEGTPRLRQIHPVRLPPAPAPNAAKLNTYRHPVPTNTVRTIMTDKLGNGLTEVTKSSSLERIAAVHVSRHIPFSKDLFPTKHSLPIATPPKKTNTKLSHAVVQKDNVPDHNETPTPIITTAVVSTQTESSEQDIPTAVASVQTEKTFVIIEQDFNFLQITKTKNITENDIQTLEIIKDSGVKGDELQKQIEKIKKDKQSNNDSDCMVIDLEDDLKNKPQNSFNLKRLLEQSKRNKHFLLSRCIALAHARITAASQQSLVRLSNSSPPHEASSQAISNPDTHSVTRDQIIATPEERTTPPSESSPTDPLDFSINTSEATLPIEINNSFQPSVTCHEPLRSSAAKQPTDINAFAKSPTTTEAFDRNNGTCSNLISQTAMAPSAFLAPSPTNSFARAHPERTHNTLASFRKSRLGPDTVETSTTALITSNQEINNNKKRKTTPDRDENIVSPRYAHNNLQQSPIQSDGGTAVHSIVQDLRLNEAAVQQQQQNQELPILQANQIPMLIQQSQMQYAGQGRHERSEQYVSLARKMQQQRVQYAQMRNQQHPYPYEQDRVSALNGADIGPQQMQLPSPVQLIYPSEQGRQSLPSPPQRRAQPIPLPEHLYPSEQRRQLVPSPPRPQAQSTLPSEHLYPSEQRRRPVPSPPRPEDQPIPPPEHLYPSEQRRLPVPNPPQRRAQPLPPPERLYPSEKRRQPVPNMPQTQTRPVPSLEHLYPIEQRRQLVASTPQQQARPVPLLEYLYPSQPSHPPPPQIPVEPGPRRVFSTELANVQGEAIQRGRNWHYPIYYDVHGNYWPRRPDLRQ